MTEIILHLPISVHFVQTNDSLGTEHAITEAQTNADEMTI